MAVCKRCGANKLTEQPCGVCAGLANDGDSVVSFQPRPSKGDPNVTPISVNLPEDFPPLAAARGFGTPEGGLASMDVHAFLNMRDWVQAACEAKGAKMTGGGVGCGQADIDIELEGYHYNISIKPLAR